MPNLSIRTNESADRTMKRFVIKFTPLILAFVLGFVAHMLWIKRGDIVDVLENLFSYYQD